MQDPGRPHAQGHHSSPGSLSVELAPPDHGTPISRAQSAQGTNCATQCSTRQAIALGEIIPALCIDGCPESETESANDDGSDYRPPRGSLAAIDAAIIDDEYVFPTCIGRFDNLPDGR